MAGMNNKTLMPCVFCGHGNPMITLSDNQYTRGWSSIGGNIPCPRVILCISAHWYVPATAVTSAKTPRTIHDFGGFPNELYEITYPAPGEPALARQVQQLLQPIAVNLDEEWGLDHGAWSVLRHAFPKADIPTVQLSLDMTKPPSFHYEIGKKLRALREEGVFIIGSGNIVHSLNSYVWDDATVKPFEWAANFDSRVRELVQSQADDKLVDYLNLGRDAALSVPTPDHYLPLLYIIALRDKGEPISFPVSGFDGGSMSMTAIQIG